MKPYKGYTGSVEFDEDDMVFHGSLAGIDDIVTFEAETAEGLVSAFHDSVDDYIAWCKRDGAEPQKPFSGRLLVRVPPELHSRITDTANRRAKSINQWITDTLDEAIRRDPDAQSSMIIR